MRRASLLLTAVVLSVAGRAAAASPNVRLAVERAPGTEECLDEGALESAVEERVQRRLFDASRPADLTLSVRFTERRPWTVLVTLADGEGSIGSRTLATPADHCSALDDLLALVVALLVETPAALHPRAAPAPVAPGSQPTKPRASPKPPISTPARTRAPRAPFEFDVRATGLGSWGILPGIAFGGELALGVKPPRWPWVRVLGELHAETERALESDGVATEAENTGRVRVSSRRLGLEVCTPGWELGRFFAYTACVGQRLGQLRVTGVGFDAVRTTTQPYYSVVAGGAGLVPLGRWGLFLGVDVEVPLTRDRFTARPDGVQSIELHRARPVALGGKLGLRVAF